MKKCDHQFDQAHIIRDFHVQYNCNTPEQTCFRVCSICGMREVDYDQIKQPEEQIQKYKTALLIISTDTPYNYQMEARRALTSNDTSKLMKSNDINKKGEKLTSQLKIAIEALEKYADEKNWLAMYMGPTRYFENTEVDGYLIAKQALARIKNLK